MDETTPAATPSSSGSPMNKTYVYVAVAAAVLILGGVAYAFKHQIKTALMPQTATPVTTTAPATPTTTVSPTAPVTAAVEVDYTNTGFSPKTVTVKKGAMVKFVNKSSASMDVASNPHPTHTDYPGFDQAASSFSGQNEFDFPFAKVGTWGYHNHFQSSDGGTVVVTE